MDAEFWRGRWRDGSIGFHEGAPNAYLTTYLSELPGTRVLVPLCGKTEDLAYLAAQGREVIGIELVQDAVRAFFAEHAVTPTITQRGVLTQYTAGGITIFAGDFFAVTREDLGKIDAIYDRAALVALPPEMRERYVAHLGELAGGTAPVLLISLAYPQAQMQGPPFSVPDDEVRAHYDAVVKLDERPAVGGRAGDVGAIERCYRAALRTGPASSAHSS